ncbi:MAG: thiol reductant ABC exporter subunit CydC [Actinomycetaceae bacterium]|nr:thiol reductant ABC exporter subunit CydC [Actinomycetaceae bacterium]
MTATHMTRRWLARRLLSVARPVIAPLAISMCARLAALLAGVAMFAIAGWQVGAFAAERVGHDNTHPWPLGVTIGALVGLALAKAVLRYLEQFSGHWVAFRSLALLRTYFFDRLEPQAPALTEALDSGDLMNRVTKDVDRVEVFFAHTLAPGVTAFVAPPLVLLWLGNATSWWIALLLAPFLFLVGVVVPLLGGASSERAAGRARHIRGRLAHHVTDSVQGVREVLAFGAQERREREMAALEEEISTATTTMGSWVAVRRGVNQTLVGAAVIAVAWLSTALFARGEIDLAQAGAAIAVALASFAPVLAVEDFAADLDQAWASARRIFAVTDRLPLVTDPENGTEKDTDGRGDILIENVDFTHPEIRLEGAGDYRARPQVLHHVSLRIPRGQFTAIVGASGCGKSTLASLLCRTWDPDSGSISIGGVDLKDLRVHRVRELVTLSPQRPHLFNESIRDNLLLGHPSATDEDIDAVLRAVNVDEWVANEPDGIHTRVGEMGERISGGQRQRLAIARSLLRGTPILIFDEATSQVDSVTENHVLDGIRQHTKGATVVFIAHRLSTVKNADQIIVMDGGRVVESGTWEELVRAGGAFTTLLAREGIGE